MHAQDLAPDQRLHPSATIVAIAARSPSSSSAGISSPCYAPPWRTRAAPLVPGPSTVTKSPGPRRTQALDRCSGWQTRPSGRPGRTRSSPHPFGTAASFEALNQFRPSRWPGPALAKPGYDAISPSGSQRSSQVWSGLHRNTWPLTRRLPLSMPAIACISLSVSGSLTAD